MSTAKPILRAFAVTLFTMGLLLALTGCSTLLAPVATPAEPDASTLQTDTEAIQTATEVAALTARVQEMETRVALLERNLLALQSAPTADASSPPNPTPTADTGVSLLPSPTATAALPPSTEPPPTVAVASPAQAAPSAPVAPAADSILWHDARAYVNQTVTVCGPVVAAQFAQQSNGQPTFLNVGKPFPEPDRFQVVIWGNQRANFPTAPEVAYRDREICVTGPIGEFRGTVEVTILGPDAIQVMGE